jgi:hypothetical protein
MGPLGDTFGVATLLVVSVETDPDVAGWEELVLAEALLQARTSWAQEEACGRAASSRAYYAVYGAARNRARDQ